MENYYINVMIVLRNKNFTKRTPLQKLGVKFKYKVLRNLNITNPGTAGRIVQKGVNAPLSSFYTGVGPGGVFVGPKIIRPAELKVYELLGLDKKMSKASVPAGRATARFVKKVKGGIRNLKDQVAPLVQSPTGGQVQAVYNR